MTRRASSRQVTKHSVAEQGMARKSLSSCRVNWRKSNGQESSNGQEEADPPRRINTEKKTPYKGSIDSDEQSAPQGGHHESL